MLALVVIWAVRFLPMQDYPQHLFLAHVVGTYEDQALGWQQHYIVDVKWGPYSLYYLVMKPLSWVFNIETSGKIWVSTAMLMLSAFADSEAQRRARGGLSLPWFLLLFVPLSFHQMYFMGFLNYLMSIPLALFALRALTDVAVSSPLKRSPLARVLLWSGLVFLAHPYTVLVLSVLGLLLLWVNREKTGVRIAAALPAGLLFAFAIWYFSQSSLSPDHATGAQWAIRWWPGGSTLDYALLIFSGMSITTQFSLVHVGVWLGLLLIAVAAARNGGLGEIPLFVRLCLFFCVSGVAILPFWLAYFSYFDLRLLPFAYLFLALAASYLSLSRLQILGVVLGASLLLCLEIPRHQKLSTEVEDLLPILDKMEAGARILPLYAECENYELDSRFFYQLHEHEHYYYHLIVGGGANPNLFPSSMIPLRFQKDAQLPPADGSMPLPLLTSHYRYLLVRCMPRGKLGALGERLVSASGNWGLVDMGPRDRK